MHKLKLPVGPWSTEPNEKAWVDPATGLHCYIKRHPELLHLCGYVGVSPSHPAYLQSYDELALSVHGGVTHADFIKDAPMPDLWWVGFDCAHMSDHSPGMARSLTQSEAYRDMKYVTRECELLAAQLASYVPPMPLHEALHIVLTRAKHNRKALTLDDETKLNEALDIVHEHANSLE